MTLSKNQIVTWGVYSARFDRRFNQWLCLLEKKSATNGKFINSTWLFETFSETFVITEPYSWRYGGNLWVRKKICKQTSLSEWCWVLGPPSGTSFYHGHSNSTTTTISADLALVQSITQVRDIWCGHSSWSHGRDIFSFDSAVVPAAKISGHEDPFTAHSTDRIHSLVPNYCYKWR